MTPDVRALFDDNFPEVAWTPDRWQDAEARLRVRRFAAGATIVAPGQATPALFGVLGGSVESRFSSAAGAVSVVENVEAGRLFGLASFVTGLPSTYEAIARASSRLVVIDTAAYTWLMDEVPGFARALMREFARRHDDTLRLLEAARHRGAEERLHLALGHFRREGRAPSSGAGARGGPWTLRATQAEIAARANVSRQTANELLAQWERQGWIERGYRGLVIRRWPEPDAG